MSKSDTTQLSKEGLDIEVHDIIVKESTSLASIDLLIGTTDHKPRWQKKDDILQTTFQPPQILSGASVLTLRLHYRLKLGPFKVPPKKHKNIAIDIQLLLSAFQCDGEEIQKWQGEYDRTVVTIAGKIKSTNQGVRGPSTTDSDPTKLSSTTENITALCPQFRILVIGKSGAGKSSLINAVFGVAKAKESRWKPGEANIEDGITSEQNERLVLHDSQGFEPGEVDNVKVVQQFIEKKSKQAHIKDRLHAVWLCLEIPSAGARLKETGVEDFLELKTCGKLGTLPLIVVLTKYDVLVGRARFDMDPQCIEGLSKESILNVAKKDAKERLEKILYDDPLDDAIEHVIVSTKRGSGYEETIDKLIDSTFSNVEKYVAEASIAVAIAQHASPKVKIDGCISVGKTKYWKGLASGTNFLGQSLKACLEVLHVDIINVWNFKDPPQYLRSTEFQNMMYSLVNDLADHEPSNPTRTLSVGLSMVGTIAGIISALAGPAAPIVVPIVATAVLAIWLYQVYQNSNGTLRRLMAYIVDLTIIMQNLHWVTIDDHNQPISRRLIKLAFKAYQESPEKDQVHNAIRDYVERVGVLERAGRDGVLAKIVELIDHGRIEAAEMHKLKSQMGDINLLAADEPW